VILLVSVTFCTSAISYDGNNVRKRRVYLEGVHSIARVIKSVHQMHNWMTTPDWMTTTDKKKLFQAKAAFEKLNFSLD
jgi:hypothetical protein